MRVPATARRSVLAVGALLAVTLVGVPAGSASAAPSLALTGYVEAGDGTGAVTPSLAALTTVAVDGVNIGADGATVGSPGADARRLLQQAHTAGRRAELLVGNFSGSLGDFDEPAAYRMLSSPARRAAVIQRLVTVAAGGWDGLHLDLESLQARDRAGLTAFTRELRAALPASTSVAMAVMASRDVAGYRATGYDLPALSASLDRIVLMAYDQHGPGWTAAGPVGGLPWVRAVLGALLTQVPPAEVDLGVAGYGYTWPRSGDGGQLSDAAARSAARTPTWDSTQAEWRGTLPGGGTVWWSDHRSLQVREQLAATTGLHGVAVWSLGLSDPLG